jgi:hypothetical protein
LKQKTCKKTNIVERWSNGRRCCAKRGSAIRISHAIPKLSISIARDSKVKHFKAKLKQIRGAVERINFIEDQTKKNLEKREQKLAEHAARKVEEMAGASKKSKKKEEAPPPPPTKKKAPKAKVAGGGEQKKKK